jgi:hypothetical protein
MANSLDMWVVQLNDLIQHAIKIRNDNVMEYKDKELEAFETGLNIFTLLMKEMVKDMLEQRVGRVATALRWWYWWGGR